MSSVLTPVHDPGNFSDAFDAVLDPVRERVTLSGELDVASVPGLLRLALQIVGRRQVDVTVDLGRLKFIDASGLGALVRLANLQRDADAHLTFERPGHFVRRAFTLGGLAGLLPSAA
jgi:anti-anti-sigma factor